MLDKNDLALMQDLLDTQTARMMDAMEAQKKEILQETAATRVLIESSIMPKFNLLAEGQQTLLETLAPKSRVEELEKEVDFLKSIIKLHSEQIAELKKSPVKNRSGHPAPVFCYLYGLFSSFQSLLQLRQMAAFSAFGRSN